jgi:hypothetical protein
VGTDALRTEATLQRTRLLLGLARGEEVVAWADAWVLAMPSVPSAVVDVSLTPPTDTRQRAGVKDSLTEYAVVPDSAPRPRTAS